MIIVAPDCCGKKMQWGGLLDQVECTVCKRTIDGAVLYAEAERNRKPFDLASAIHADINQLYEHGHAIKASALVYVTSPTDSAVARRQLGITTVVESWSAGTTVERWTLHSAAGPVDVLVDANHPRGSFTRMWRCACSALFSDNDHRLGECPGCMRPPRRALNSLDARMPSPDPSVEFARIAAVPPEVWAERDRMFAEAQQGLAPLSTEAFKAIDSAFKVLDRHQHAPPLETRPAYLKHGPGALGGSGPCDAACRKCAAEMSERSIKIDMSPPGGWRTGDCARDEPADPLDVQHDGVTLRRLLEMDANRRTERIVGVILSPAQRSAISAHWSAELRAKVAATKQADAERLRNRVTITHDED